MAAHCAVYGSVIMQHFSDNFFLFSLDYALKKKKKKNRYVETVSLKRKEHTSHEYGFL